MNRLRLQLIALLVGVALLPALPAAWTADQLFRRTLDPILHSELTEAAEAGLAANRDLLEQEFTRLVDAVFGGGTLDTLREERIAQLSEKERASLLALAELGPPRPRERDGIRLLLPPQRATLHGREAVVARIEGTGGEPVWIRASLPPALAERAEAIGAAARRLETLRRERETIFRGLLATFLAVYGLILLAVLWLGLVLASRWTRPLAVLGHGIDRVSSGHLDTRVPVHGSGELHQLLARFNEMTGKLQEQRDELRRLEKLAAWRRMARSLAHEIKNPLTPIQLAAQQLRDSYAGGDAEHERLLHESTEIIEEEVESLRELVHEFSQFARLPEPHMERLSVASLLEDLRQLLGEDKLRLLDESDSGAELASDAVHVWGDRGQMHRALLNLLTNAFEAQRETETSDPVEIAVRVHGAGQPQVEIQIRDRGPGVQLDEIRHIFEPDYTTKSDGMGLGLAIVDATVAHHHGAVVVRPRPGGGCIFVVTLPAAVEGSRAGPKLRAPEEGS